MAAAIARERRALQEILEGIRAQGRPVVLVPTMGDLHAGHLSLVEQARPHGAVVVSIFVNPTQFAAGEDFDAYPRDLAADVAALERVGGVDVVFAPLAQEVYQPGDSTVIDVGPIAEPLCGAFRPGHFQGVATVVAKLFGLVQPDIAVFGQKDAQQCLVLRRLVADLCLPIGLVLAPTVREPDGLALSSRNRYLDAEQRQDALRVSRALRAGRGVLESGERERTRVEAAMREQLGALDVDYAQARDLPNLRERERLGGRILLAVAAHVGRARLIDNLSLQVDDDRVQEAPLLGASVGQVLGPGGGEE